MRLFDADGQNREKATLWRLFSLAPLFSYLLNDHVCGWFAINIPMSLVEGGRDGEIDIIAKLLYPPRSRTEWFYRTWEAKVGLLGKDGVARSLKAGKTQGTVKQMRNYRRFGAASVTLLDLYLCEDGTLNNSVFPTGPIRATIMEKQLELAQEGFGYQVIPFEHQDRNDRDYGLRLETKTVLPQRPEAPQGPFAALVEKLDAFFNGFGPTGGSFRSQVTYCEGCKHLQLIRVNEHTRCPSCNHALIEQIDFDTIVKLPQFRLDANGQPYIEHLAP